LQSKNARLVISERNIATYWYDNKKKKWRLNQYSERVGLTVIQRKLKQFQEVTKKNENQISISEKEICDDDEEIEIIVLK
jgi:hypothetical protein